AEGMYPATGSEQQSLYLNNSTTDLDSEFTITASWDHLGTRTHTTTPLSTLATAQQVEDALNAFPVNRVIENQTVGISVPAALSTMDFQFTLTAVPTSGPAIPATAPLASSLIGDNSQVARDTVAAALDAVGGIGGSTGFRVLSGAGTLASPWNIAYPNDDNVYGDIRVDLP
ncbi:MAG: hypothetical protein GY888_17710, partial [Planctomycetaceae bacterium]|nr:hypothetical protein [Planctomycetaceae bacterium]